MDDGVCATDECPFKRLVRLGPFFEYYKYLAASYEPEARMNPALKNHEDIFRIIRILRNEPTISRAQLCAEVFSTQSPGFSIPDVDRQNAIDMAVRAMLMVNCAAQHRSLGLVEQGVYPVPWLDTVSFADFVADIFPKTDNPIINDHDEEEVRLLSTKSALLARKLKKRTGIKFRATDDLRNHLKLDRRDAVVELFHHTAFLKESLRLTKDKKPNLSIAETLKLCVRSSHIIPMSFVNYMRYSVNADVGMSIAVHFPANWLSKYLIQYKRFSSLSTTRNPVHSLAH
jgi:hypothetical protein